MIDLLDETLRELIIQKGLFDRDSVEISFEQPTGDWAAGLTRPTINCYLYDIRENSELRSAEWIVGQNANGQATKRLAPRRFDLSYLITVWTQGQVEDEHAILWRVLGVLASHPVLPQEICQGTLQEQPYPIRAETAQPSVTIDSLPDLWSVMDNPLRPSINYVVTLAMEREVVFTSPLVLTKRVIIGQKPEPLMNPEEIVQVAGIVTREGIATAEAQVTFVELGRTVTSDAFGRYYLSNVPSGAYHVQVRADASTTERIITVPAPDVATSFYDLQL